ncbi:MAG: GAF domain-containing protein [Deltaproteobacteria bacterium]|nr:GAF domain-containing protein [Deltaproteobacteria bacterium]
MTQQILYIPNDYSGLVESAKGRFTQPVQTETYSRLEPSLFNKIKNEPILLAMTARDLFDLINQPGGSAALAFAKGKVILSVSREDFPKLNVNQTQSVYLVMADPLPDAVPFAFSINKAMAEIAEEDEIETLRSVENKQARDLETLNEIGMALSTEKDLDRLLDRIVLKCREMTYADAGSLYMIESDPAIPEDPANYMANKKMRFQVAQNFSKKVPFRSFVVDITKTSVYGYVAITQNMLNFEDAYHISKTAEYGWGGKDFDKSISYRTKSMLTVAMVNYRGETIAVIQLINRKISPDIVLENPETCIKDILPFSEDDCRMVMSIASQASIAIQNAQLVEDIKKLFNGFINASVGAIESRDPTTSGHSQRVATLTVGLAEQMNQTDTGRFKDLQFTYDQIQEIRYASLLHDFGKIGVRESVLVKAKKLFPHELQSVVDRFALIRRTFQVEQLEYRLAELEKKGGKPGKGLISKAKDMEKRLQEAEEFLAFILKCNEPTVLSEGGFERLNEIAKLTFPSMDGRQVPFLTDAEAQSLSIPKGSLNEADRKEIESHVTHTYNFLRDIPWTSNLRAVPEIAYAHHEKLNGEGYPTGKKGAEISVQSRMMTISDIFDALTAWDRPYKKAIPVERALDILKEEVKSHHVDSDLLDMFIEAEVYKLVARSE